MSGKASECKAKELLEFTSTFAVMLNASLSVKDALDVLGTVHDKGPIKDLIDILAADIRKGIPFHLALERSGAKLPPVYVALVRIGERVGSLNSVFARLVEWMEEQKKIRENITGALVYPAFILGLTVVGVFGLVTMILPKIQALFTSIGKSMSGDFASGQSGLIGFFAILLFAGLAIAGLSAITMLGRKRGWPAALVIDGLTMRIPGLRRFVVGKQSLSFCFAMETLVSSGFLVEEALADSMAVISNSAYRAAIARVRERVMNGMSLSTAFASEAVLPKIIGRWCMIGEKTAKVDAVFSQLKAHFKSETEKTTSKITALAEPALTAVIGGIVLYVVLSFVVPLLGMYNDIGNF